MKKFIHIEAIFILQAINHINIFLGDLLLCYFAIIGIKNYTLNTNLLIMCISFGILYWLLEFYQYRNVPFDYWNVNKLSKSIFIGLAFYGIVLSKNIYITLYLCIITVAIGKIINHFKGTANFSIRKKETLFHELGHFFMCKKYNILNPVLIDLYTIDTSDGRLVATGSFDDVTPFECVTMLLAGYVTGKYIVHNKSVFTIQELRTILLVEYENKLFTDDYLNTLVLIYLNDILLEKAVSTIIELIEINRKEILLIANENKYKRTINLKKYIETDC